MDDKNTVQCWEDLANAVVLQALEDYRDACRVLRKHPDLKKAEERRRSLERFFASRWCRLLSAAELGPLLEKNRKGEGCV